MDVTLLLCDFAEAVKASDPLATFRAAYEACGSQQPLDRSMYVDVKTYLVDDILTKVDRMSMAVSLEARVPLLDHELLEFAATVPASLKLKRGRSKYLLRRLLEKRIPKVIVDRPKHGFSAPIGAWSRRTRPIPPPRSRPQRDSGPWPWSGPAARAMSPAKPNSA